MSTGTNTAGRILTELDELFRVYGDTIFRLAYLHTKNRADAEDVLQDVLIRAMNNKKPFQNPEHQKAWLLRVTVNRVNSMRTSAWFRHWAKVNENIPADEPEDFSDVYAAVCKLDEKYRTVIHLFYYEEYDVKGIAGILGISESAVKTRLFRGRELLRASLKGEYGDI